MKRYNKFLKSMTVVEKGEELCTQCQGAGLYAPKQAYNKYGFPLTKKAMLVCNKCLGEGKIDWVEKATGKRVFYEEADNQGQGKAP